MPTLDRRVAALAGRPAARDVLLRRGRGILVSTPLLMALVLVAALSVVGHRTARELNVPNRPELPRYGMADFRDNIYYPVVAFLDGVNPYDPAVAKSRYPIHHTWAPYSPLALLVFLPLGLLPLQAAELLYFALQTVLIVGLAALVLQVCAVPLTASGVLGLSALLVLSRPGESTLFLGHYTIVLVVGVYLALDYQRRQPWWAAAGLALATMKPTFGLPLVVLLLAAGAIRTVTLGLGLAAALTAIPALVLLVRAGGVVPFLAPLAETYRTFAAFPENPAASSVTRIDTVSFASRLVGTSLGAAGELAITVAMLVIAAVVIRRLCRRDEPSAHHVAGSLVCLTMLGCVYHHSYDALILALPLTLVITGRMSPLLNNGALRWGLAVLLIVPMVNYLATYTALNALHISGRGALILTSVNGAALTAAWCVLVGVAFRRLRRASPSGTVYWNPEVTGA